MWCIFNRQIESAPGLFTQTGKRYDHNCLGVSSKLAGLRGDGPQAYFAFFLASFESKVLSVIMSRKAILLLYTAIELKPKSRTFT